MKSIGEETARKRKEELRKIEDELEEKELDDVEEKEKKEQPPKKDFKYYFNRFRYYHYYIAEKVDVLFATMCMWIIKIMFFLIGFRFPSIEESNFNFDDIAN